MYTGASNAQKNPVKRVLVRRRANSRIARFAANPLAVAKVTKDSGRPTIS